MEFLELVRPRHHIHRGYAIEMGQGEIATELQDLLAEQLRETWDMLVESPLLSARGQMATLEGHKHRLTAQRSVGAGRDRSDADEGENGEGSQGVPRGKGQEVDTGVALIGIGGRVRGAA